MDNPPLKLRSKNKEEREKIKEEDISLVLGKSTVTEEAISPETLSRHCGEVFDFFQKNITGPHLMSPYEMSELTTYTKVFGKEEVLECIKAAVMYNKKSLKYVFATLKGRQGEKQRQKSHAAVVEKYFPSDGTSEEREVSNKPMSQILKEAAESGNENMEKGAKLLSEGRDDL